MSILNVWKLFCILFIVLVRNDGLGISGFVEGKYWEEKRKVLEGVILNGYI